jgi:hypothetical protein
MNEIPRDAGRWAKPVSKLHVETVPDDAANLVEGKRLVGPIQGFGKMWQKTYRVRLDGLEVSPTEVIGIWKERFAEFWPEGNTFYPSLAGMEPGEVGLIKAAGPAGMKLKTGVMVLYADEASFTEMTPEGHMLAGWITFSAHEQDGATVAQAQLLIRAQDPLTELGLALGGHRVEDRFWEQTLSNLAAHFGVEGDVETQVVCVDRKRQWSKAGNIRHSAAIRSTLHALRPRRGERRARRS